VPAGIIMLIVFLAYQQVENHLLNPIIMSRTVRLNPFWVLLAVLVGATLGGRIGSDLGTFVGALIGIPLGGAIQVIVREIRRGPDTDDMFDVLDTADPADVVSVLPADGSPADPG
jgi:predicted PurR-regulated permease PerM